MKRREITLLVSGLIVGLILGILLSETDLFGTVGGEKDKTPEADFYLVELNATQTWLNGKYPDDADKVEAALRVIVPVEEGPIVNRPALTPDQEDVKYLLKQTYVALFEDDQEKTSAKAGEDPSVCLGFDDDPYKEDTGVYLYLTIPSDDAKNLEIPKEWVPLAKPKTNDLYWELLACYPPELE